MPKANFFGHLGLYVDPSFLTADLCSTIFAEMVSSQGHAASVYYGLDTESRSVFRKEISDHIRNHITNRLTHLLPILSRHFGRPLHSFQEPNFLLYREGDFYVPHIDRVDEPGFPDYVRSRVVSTVIFVNSSTSAATAGVTEFKGGELAFFGLLDDPRAKHIGLPLEGEAGTLVAFPSELCHEVRAVAEGVRCTIVTWFV